MSVNDNISLRDGLDAVYKLRSKDVSTLGDGSLHAVRHLTTLYPVDYGVGGSFQLTSKSGIMAAGLLSGSTIYAFRWTSSSLLALLKRIRIQAWSLGTGFAAGLATFDVYRATSWSVADSGGATDTISGDNGNLRTAMPGSALSEIRHSSTAAMTAGTRTLDAQPFDTLNLAVSTATNTPFTNLPSSKLFERLQGEHPLVMVQNEGFVIRATVPATGTWSFAITPEWDEVPLVNF